MSPMQIVFVLIVGFLLLGLLLNLIRYGTLSEKYSLVWIVIAFGIIATPLLQPLYNVVIDLFGFVSPVTFYLVCALLLVLLLLLQFSLAFTAERKQRKRMIIELAMLKNELETVSLRLDDYERNNVDKKK